MLLKRLPRRTVRLRLTLLYGGLFLASGAALLAITIFLMANATGFSYEGPNGSAVSVSGRNPSDRPAEPPSRRYQSTGGLTPAQAEAEIARTEAAVRKAKADGLWQLVGQSGIALAVMAVLSVVLGWIMAGRVLRPLRTLTASVRNISATNLHDRLALAGPNDEIKELGDTFDGLLARLEAAFQAQKRFVANASHELRTPLARQRALAQVALTDPRATADTLRKAHERVLASGEEQESLIEALLTLARGQAGVDTYETFDLAALTEEVRDARRPEAEKRGVQVDARLRAATMSGDRRLMRQLVGNLVDNAIRHNTEPGWVAVVTGIQDGQPILLVSNSGPVVPEDEVDRLSEPFHRLGADRVHRSRGHGLGLSIVDAIARTHGAAVTTRAQPGGGLEVEVTFAPAPAPVASRSPLLSPHGRR